MSTDETNYAHGDLPKCVLLVEDNIIILMDTEEVLTEMGVEVVMTATGSKEALAAVEKLRPDFALLDVDLGVDTGFDIAARLLDLDIPFAFVTGYGDSLPIPAQFAGRPRLLKPHTVDALRKVLTKVGR